MKNTYQKGKLNMFPLYSSDEFQNAKSRDLLPLKCEQCGEKFLKEKKYITQILKGCSKNTGCLCSTKCANDKKTTSVKCNCTTCGKEIVVRPSDFKKYKCHFCSRSCSATFNNKNRIVEKGKTKILKCFECGNDFEASNRASDKSKRCPTCFEKYYSICSSGNHRKLSECSVCGEKHNKNNPQSCWCKKSQLIKNLVKYFKFDISKKGTTEVFQEFEKIKESLNNDYYTLKLSIPVIAEKYGHSHLGNFAKIMKSIGINFRNLKDALRTSIEENRYVVSTNNLKYKTGWHTSWNNKKFFYRSSYELEFAKKLDTRKIEYEMEFKAIKYFNTSTIDYRHAYPDFYIPNSNMIIELKSKGTFYNDVNNPHREQDMKDKFCEYRKLGYNVKLFMGKIFEDATHLVS